MAQQQTIHKFTLGSKELEGKTAEFQYDRGWYSITDIVGETREIVYRSRNAQEAYMKWNVYIGRKKERPVLEERARGEGESGRRSGEGQSGREERRSRDGQGNREDRRSRDGRGREDRRPREESGSREDRKPREDRRNWETRFEREGRRSRDGQRGRDGQQDRENRRARDGHRGFDGRENRRDSRGSQQGRVAPENGEAPMNGAEHAQMPGSRGFRRDKRHRRPDNQVRNKEQEE